ncbi:MAG: TlpA family protein disulfide reductase [Candidatus Eremiobacteraeota bacterium]|nr:TlpA family protein disulfide reductase [Candidatus Eremiobacteraeota bacterium]MBV8367182.1 TlpA family protein disulfide reductase [Candidatus Eremiobacteraeota bacterium]
MPRAALAFGVFAVLLMPPAGRGFFLDQAAAAPKPPLVEQSAPAFSVQLIANGDGEFVLAQQRGHGVYVNFFASWCKPCTQEAQTIETIAPPFMRQGVRVVGIAVLDDRAAALAFARAHHLTYPIAFDTSGKTGAAYRLEQLPLHVFIGPDGIVDQYVSGGPIPAQELRAGLTQIAR